MPFTINQSSISINRSQIVLNPSASGIVTNGLIIYTNVANSSSYPGTGTSLFDLSGNNYTGTFAGGLVAADYNSAGKYINFGNSGSGSYIDFGTPANLANISTATWQMIFRQPTTDDGNFFSKNASGTSGWSIGFDTGDLILYWVLSTTSMESAVAQSNFTTNAWNMATIQFTGGTSAAGAKFWVNTTEITSRTITVNGSGSHPSDTGVTFGLGFNGLLENGNFSGYLGGFTIYNRVLTSAEITQNYNLFKTTYALP